MPESLVQVTSGAGPKLHTWQRTVGANNVEDEFVIPGEYPLATYVITAQSVATNTANDHVLQVMAGASNYVRIRRITVEQSSNATAAAVITFQLLRLTTAGTGGTALTPRPYDSSDAAAGATAMTLPTVKGTEGVQVGLGNLVLRQAVSATSAQADDSWVWTPPPGGKGIIIPAGATNGLALKTLTAFGAAGSVNVVVEFVETTFAG